VKSANDLTAEIEEIARKFNIKRMELNKQKRAFEEELIEFNNGINYFTKNFRETPVFNKYADIIERAEPKKTNYSVMDLCTQLLKNDSHFNEEYTAFQRYVNEFAGKFRLENHFNFIIRNDATQGEYERFAQNLRSFINEAKIELSIAETATQIGLVTDSIATKVRELSGQKDKIQHIITLIAEDFKKAEFEESKLIEFIKIRLEDSDNKVYNLMRYIITENQYSRIFESKEYPLDNVLFNQWDKNGTTIDIGKYVGLNDNEVVEYIKRYYGDDYFPIVKKEIRNIIKNYTECDGDVFGLDVISISFGKGSWQDTTYQINLSVDPKSPVYKTIDMNDWEEIMTLYGQIEGCVENKLNDVIYNKYGCFTSHVLITST
jgi:hypothetical protein